MSNIMFTAAELMAIAARTAPKAVGKDFVVLEILQGDQLEKLADAMVEYGRQTGRRNFDRDGENVRRSAAVLLIGLKNAEKTGLNCGACGEPRCAELKDLQPGPEFDGPICAWRLLDLGIAIGSAAKMASILNIDNRIMYRIGVVARRLGLIDAEIAVGLPLSATGKNIYFDR
ncbi:MAG: ferredoxin domain-containing protein [Moorellaceae bacterium]